MTPAPTRRAVLAAAAATAVVSGASVPAWAAETLVAATFGGTWVEVQK